MTSIADRSGARDGAHLGRDVVPPGRGAAIGPYLRPSCFERRILPALMTRFILVDSTMTEPYGSVFFYTDRRWLDTQELRYAIAGTAPVLVLQRAVMNLRERPPRPAG